MDYIVDWILPFLVVLTVLIFVHELGHFLVARACGVLVETFSIGFGPELFGKTARSGTRWKVSALPLGGYVKMYGEETFGNDAPDAPPDPQMRALSFRHKSLKQRAAIVAAGPAANLLFAIVVLLGLFTVVGAPTPTSAVGAVQDDSAAAAAGFQAGDRILSIDGEPVTWFEDVRRVVNANPDVALRFVLQRGEQELELVATPRPTEQTVDGETKYVGLLGIKPDLSQPGFREMSFGEASVAAVTHTYDLTAQIVGAIGSMLGGGGALDEVGGPLRIAQISGQVAQDGIVQLLYFMAALSVNLALINLLPIPILDGGHLVLYGIEAATGKPLNQRIVEYAFRFGMVFIVCLMLLATWNDLISLQVVDFFKRLVS